MEALLEKEGDVESWNDERMDELSRRMDAGFEKAATKVELMATNEEMNRRFDGMESQFGRINDRLDKLFYGLGFFGLTLVFNLAADKF